MSSVTTTMFMIGVAARLAGMHPQTLRVYERRGLITPRRSQGNTRLYSSEDVERLRRIQELSDAGLNLAGIERVLELEAQLEHAERRVRALREELTQSRAGSCTELVLARSEQTALAPRYAPVLGRRWRRV